MDNRVELQWEATIGVKGVVVTGLKFDLDALEDELPFNRGVELHGLEDLAINNAEEDGLVRGGEIVVTVVPEVQHQGKPVH